VRRFRRPCPSPGCPSLWDGVECKACGHKPEKVGWDRDPDRRTAAERGYDADWFACRAAYVAEHPFCEDCLENGRPVKVDEVHHIEPFDGKDDPKRLDWNNLRSLCEDHHDAATRQRKAVNRRRREERS